MNRRRGRGEGSIRRLPDRRWQAWISLGVDSGGKRRRKAKIFPSKPAALAWIAEQSAAGFAARTQSASGLALRDYLCRWAAARHGTVEDGTADFYQKIVARLARQSASGLPLGALTPAHIESLYAELANTTPLPTLAKCALVVRMALKDAVRQGLIGTSPAASVKPPRTVRKVIRPLDRPAVSRLLAVAAMHRLHALWLLALDTGARQGELLALDWRDIDLDTRTMRIHNSLQEIHGAFKLKIPKSPSSRRSVIFAPSTESALREHAARHGQAGTVFRSVRGTYIRKRSLHGQLRTLLSAAGLPHISFHALRHTCATLLLSAGVNIRLVSQRLGHNDPGTTLRLYAHVLDSDQGKAADAMEGIIGNGQAIQPR